jgi:D-glycero-D-manno-heptose 1,7-bisphosphate phosphatase
VTPRVALLDRDGTLNVKAPEGEYVTRPEDVVVLPGAAQAVRELNDAGVHVAVVTNQRCLSLGLLDEPGLQAVNAAVADALARAGAHVDAWYHCPHGLDDGCPCRKPLPGMLLDALRDAGAQPSEAVMVGDSASDVEAGRAAGVRTVRLGEDGAPPADAAVEDLAAAVRWALA